MPRTPHIEHHFTAGASVRDIVIGMSDGLTVPFALAAGLSGAVSSTSIIVTAGLAEIAAGSISMGLGGYLAARSDAEHYTRERAREEQEVREIPAAEAAEVGDVLVTAPLDELVSQRPLIPAGLLAGTVTQVERNPTEPFFLRVTAAPRVNLQRLEVVEVIIPGN